MFPFNFPYLLVKWVYSAMTSSTTVSLPEKLETLRPQLSKGASINISTEPGFEILSSRWSDLSAPQPGALVNVATEDDVAATVCTLNFRCPRLPVTKLA